MVAVRVVYLYEDFSAATLITFHIGNVFKFLCCLSAAHRLDWGEKLKQVLSRDTPYVLLTSEQLVGVCLFVFVRSHLVNDIR